MKVSCRPLIPLSSPRNLRAEMTTGLTTKGRLVNARLDDLQINELSPLVIGPAISEDV